MGLFICINDNTNMDVYGIMLYLKQMRHIPFWNQQIIANSKNKLSYGVDKTGDIYKLENANEFIDSLDGQLCNLVTADGGFDYSK